MSSFPEEFAHKYSRSTSTVEALLKTLAKDPYNDVNHVILADALDEDTSHDYSPITEQIRAYASGQKKNHGGGMIWNGIGRQDDFHTPDVDDIHVGKQGIFDLYLDHGAGQPDTYGIQAVAKAGNKHLHYFFHFDHKGIQDLADRIEEDGKHSIYDYVQGKEFADWGRILGEIRRRQRDVDYEADPNYGHDRNDV